MATPVTQLQPAASSSPKATFAGLLDRYKNTIIQKMPRGVNSERLFNIARGAILGNPKILECEPAGVLLAVNQILQLGLEPNGPTGQAYIIPRWNSRAHRHEATILISFKGMIDLALRSDSCLDIEAQVVYENDKFSFVRTQDGPKLTHEPSFDDDPGVMKLVYAIAWRQSSPNAAVVPHIEILPAREVLGIKSRFMATDRNGKPVGPWVTDEAEMWRKTAVRRLAKYLQLTPDIQVGILSDGATIVASDDLEGALSGAARLEFSESDNETSSESSSSSTQTAPSQAPASQASAATQEKATSSASNTGTTRAPATQTATAATTQAPSSAQASSKPEQKPATQATTAKASTDAPKAQQQAATKPAPSTEEPITIADPFEDLGMFMGE